MNAFTASTHGCQREAIDVDWSNMMYISSGTCFAVCEFAAQAASSDSGGRSTFTSSATSKLKIGESNIRGASGGTSGSVPLYSSGGTSTSASAPGCDETPDGLHPTGATASPPIATAHTNAAKLIFGIAEDPFVYRPSAPDVTTSFPDPAFPCPPTAPCRPSLFRSPLPSSGEGQGEGPVSPAGRWPRPPSAR